MKKVKFTFLLWAWMLCPFLPMKAQVANSLNFDGTNDYVAKPVFLASNTNITLEARIKLAGLTPSNKYILSNGTGTTGVGVFLTPSNSVVIRSGSSTYTTSYVVPSGSFVLLSVVFTPNFVNLYVNGVLTQTMVVGFAPAPTGSFWIGANGGSDFFAGDIDEVRIWNRAVCAQEITHRANCSATGLEPLAAAIYKFNQGVAAGNNATVTTLNDATPNNNHATLYNLALTGTSSNWINSTGAYGGQCSIAPLTLTISPTSAIICPGGSATLTASGGMTYTWNTGATSSAITVTAAGVYSVLGTTSTQCYGMAMAGVSLVPNPTVSVNSASICAGQTAVLVASGASTYSWNTGATTASIAVSPSVNTAYTVTGFNGTCSDTKTTMVTIVPSPTLSMSSTTSTFCTANPPSVTLTASGASSYSWSTGASGSSIVVTPSVTTVYSVTGYNGSCSATNSYTITGIVSPTVTISPSSPSVCSGASVVLTASGASTYSWSTGATSFSIVVSPTTNTTYSVTGYNIACSDTKTVQVIVQNCTGINELVSESGVNIYPVPASDILTITMEEPSEVSVYNLVGQVLYREFGKEVKVNTSEWSRGTYVVQIRNAKGQSVSRKIYLTSTD
jgi:hypothetical protein